MEAQIFYRNPKWKRTRDSSVEDDDYSCKVCGSDYNSHFNIGHIIFYSDYY